MAWRLPYQHFSPQPPFLLLSAKRSLTQLKWASSCYASLLRLWRVIPVDRVLLQLLGRYGHHIAIMKNNFVLNHLSCPLMSNFNDPVRPQCCKGPPTVNHSLSTTSAAQERRDTFVKLYSICGAQIIYFTLSHLAQGGKKGKAAGEGLLQWDSEREKVLQALVQLLQLDIRSLWNLSLVEEEFIRYSVSSY